MWCRILGKQIFPGDSISRLLFIGNFFFEPRMWAGSNKFVNREPQKFPVVQSTLTRHRVQSFNFSMNSLSLKDYRKRANFAAYPIRAWLRRWDSHEIGTDITSQRGSERARERHFSIQHDSRFTTTGMRGLTAQ